MIEGFKLLYTGNEKGGIRPHQNSKKRLGARKVLRAFQ